MNTTTFRLLAALGMAAFLPAIASPAFAYTGQNLAHEAKISIDQARQIALKAHPGKITDEELEREAGGSGLRYSFDVKRGSVTQEVGVDAATGRVLENKVEGPNPD
jgi:uncharacterized membrane protein YkoI